MNTGWYGNRWGVMKRHHKDSRIYSMVFENTITNKFDTYQGTLGNECLIGSYKTLDEAKEAADSRYDTKIGG